MLIQKRQLILTKQGGCSYNNLRWHFPAYVQTQLSWSFSHPAAWKLRTSLLPTMNSRRKTSTVFKARKTTWLPHSHAELNKGCWLRSPSCAQSLLASMQGFKHTAGTRLLSSPAVPVPTVRSWFSASIGCAIYAVRESYRGSYQRGKWKNPSFSQTE